MSNVPVVPPGSSLDNPIVTDEVGSDDVLQSIVATADDSDFSVSVTLAANGCLVTGLLIGQARFFQELEIQHAELRESLTTPFRKHFVDERDPAAETDPLECRYVHLKDARYLTGAGFAPQPNSTGFFWRGRIAHVSAWSFGAIRSNPM